MPIATTSCYVPDLEQNHLTVGTQIDAELLEVRITELLCERAVNSVLEDHSTVAAVGLTKGPHPRRHALR